MPLRGGFRVPNAATYAPDYETSQPDQGDYLILGNGQFGVVYGCLVTLAGSTVSIGSGPHVVVLDGLPQLILPNSSAGLASGGPRFDLVVYEASGGFEVITGVVSDNPVLPDVTDAMVVLAAVFTPLTGTRRIIDKRNYLQTTVVGRDAPNLIRNYVPDGTAIHVNMDGDGKLSWHNTASIEHVGGGVVRIIEELEVDTITVGISGTIRNKRIITAENIEWGSVSSRPAVADTGDLWVDTGSGDISVWKTDTDGVGKWMSPSVSLPSGTKIESFLEPSRMPGWLHLDGSVRSRADVGNLWSLFPGWQLPGNLFQLPDTRGRVSVGAGFNGSPSGATYGTPMNAGGATSVAIKQENMASHTHAGSGVNTGEVANHTHSGSGTADGDHVHSVASSGSHDHTANEFGHQHFSDNVGITIVAAEWNGVTDTQPQGIIPPWYNGAPQSGFWVKKGSNLTSMHIAGVIITGGQHSHTVASGGAHTHNLSIAAAGSHSHTLPAHSAVGGDQPLVVGPAAISTYHYIKL